MAKTVTGRTSWISRIKNRNDNRIFSTLNFLFRNIFGGFYLNRKTLFPEDSELLPKIGSVTVGSK
jgi:hypothetical protein